MKKPVILSGLIIILLASSCRYITGEAVEPTPNLEPPPITSPPTLKTGWEEGSPPPAGIEGREQPGLLTGNEKTEIVEIAVTGQPASEWLQGRTDYRVGSIDWYAIVWRDGNPTQWWSLEYDRIVNEGVPDFVSPYARWYPGVTIATGEGTITQMQVAVDLGSGKVVMSSGPYPSLSSPDRFKDIPSPETLGLEHARPYQVVREGNLANEDQSRSVGLWFITSEEASGFEEYAQTAIQAVLDLNRLYGRDYTSVLLLPSDKLVSASLSYAQASFAADGKGAAGMTGDAPAKEGYWKVRAADRELNERELAIAELWQAKQWDFRQQASWSSSLFDTEALRHYIASTLNIPYDEAQMPNLEMHEYELDQAFIDWMIALAPTPVPDTAESVEAEGADIYSGEDTFDYDNAFGFRAKRITLEEAADTIGAKVPAPTYLPEGFDIQHTYIGVGDKTIIFLIFDRPLEQREAEPPDEPKDYPIRYIETPETQMYTLYIFFEGDFSPIEETSGANLKINDNWAVGEFDDSCEQDVIFWSMEIKPEDGSTTRSIALRLIALQKSEDNDTLIEIAESISQ